MWSYTYRHSYLQGMVLNYVQEKCTLSLHLQMHVTRKGRALLCLGPTLKQNTSGFRHPTFNFKNVGVILWRIIVWERLLTLEQVWWLTRNFTVLVMISFGLYYCILRTLHLHEQTVFWSTTTWQNNIKLCVLSWLYITENGTLQSQSWQQEKCRTPTVSVDK